MSKQKLTRTLSWVLTLAMVVMLLPTVAFADSATDATALAETINTWANGNGITATASGSIVTVTSTGTPTATTILDLTISAGVTVDWQAVLTSSAEKVININTASGANSVFKVSTSANLTSTSTANENFIIDNDSANTEVEVTGGTITGGAGNNSYGIRNNSTGIVTVSGGEISGGLGTAGYGIHNHTTGTVNVSSGTINGGGTSNSYGINNNSTGIVTVSDGIINGGSANSYSIRLAGGGTLNLSGGTINSAGTTQSNGIYSWSASEIILSGTVSINCNTTGMSTNNGIYSSSPSGSVKIASGADITITALVNAINIATALVGKDGATFTVTGGTTAQANETLTWQSNIYKNVSGTTAKYAKITATSGGGITNITELNTAIAAFNSGSADATATITGSFDTNGTAITAINNTSGKKLTIKSDATHRTITRGRSDVHLFIVTQGELIFQDITIDGDASTYNPATKSLVYIDSNGRFTMKSGATLQNAIANNGGTGVSVVGTFNMEGGTIKNCIASGTSDGGGVYISGGTFNMSGGEISGNAAADSGGGVFHNGTAFNVSGTAKIIGNKKGTGGANTGGVYLYGGKSIAINTTLSSGALIGIEGMQTNTEGTAAVSAVPNMTYAQHFYISNASGNINGMTLWYDSSAIKLKAYDVATLDTKWYSGSDVWSSWTPTATITSVAKVGGSVLAEPGQYTNGNFNNAFVIVKGYIDTLSSGVHTFAIAATFGAMTETRYVHVIIPPTTYTLTVSVSTSAPGGTVSAGKTTLAAGETTTITATPNTGYSFSGWTVFGTGSSVASASSASTTFTMGSIHAMAIASFTANSTGNTGGSSSGGGSSTPTPPTSNVIVDGKAVDAGKVTTSGDTTTVTVNQDTINKQLETATSNVTVTVPNETGTAVAQLAVQNVDDMAAKDMSLTVQVGNVQYEIPTTAIDTSRVLAALGADNAENVSISVIITTDMSAAAQAAVEAAITGGAELVIPPMEFKITATYNGQTVEIDTFSQYVSRAVEITAEQAARITTAVVVDPDGTTRQVPTRVYQGADGKWYAEVNSLTNSTYALIYNELTFADAKGKWYEAAVNEMGSRKIISGIGNDLFAGERDITRAEFAAIIVRALGLPATGKGTVFSDVSASAWYSGAVGTAYEYGLVSGVGGNQFAPDQKITRQEAMLMIQRMAKIAGFTGSAGSISNFTDNSNVSSWALDAAKWNVGSGLIVGSGGKLNPTDNITRAETATLVLKLMQKAKLVDVRTKF